ncbi:MAG: metallophosphoesterase [Oscillospiraceae bacterium]|nr:metallophosphoesterase [Oscillospiraceae bacterium]
MQKNLSKVLSCLLAIVMVLGMIPVIASAAGAQQIYDGGAFTAGTDLTVSVSNDQPVTKMSFDYKLTTEGHFNIALLPDWSSYFGYFKFDGNGEVGNYAGVTTEVQDNGYIRVFIDMAAVTQKAGTPSDVITMLFIRGSYTTGSGEITNIRFNESALKPVNREALAPGVNQQVFLHAPEALGQITFEYKITNGGKIDMALLPDWSSYFGYYTFLENGTDAAYNGVTTQTLDNGNVRVTITMAELTNQVGTPSTAIDFLFLRNTSTASGYIQSVEYILEKDMPRGQMLTPGVNQSIDLDATADIATISFDYKLTDGNKFTMALLPNWTSYFGYFGFMANGTEGQYSGVTYETLEDGYIHVEIDLAQVTAIAGTPSKLVDFLFINGAWSDANGYIDNVQYTLVPEIEDTVAIYQNGAVAGTYADLASAIAAYESGIITLLTDVAEDVTVNGDLYLDLNGKSLTGNISGNGTIYGMDSANDTYDASLCGGIMGNVSCNVASSFKNEETAKRYIAIANDNGYTFHRIYVGVTKQSLAPTVTGVGYKAEFYADETVKAQVSGIGYNLWLEGGKTVSREAAFKNELTLRVKNYDVINYGETNLYANVWMTIGDETITSTEYSLTLREMVETVNAQWANYSTEQKVAVQAMVNANLAAMTGWEIENIINWVESKVTVDYTFSGHEANRAGYAEGTATVSEAVAGETYGFYWADANGKLAGYRSLGVVTIPEDQTSASITIGENITIPAQADRLAVVLESSGDVVGAYTLGAKANEAQLETKFAVISDVHTNYNQGEQFLLNGLKQFEAEGVAYVIISGDVGESDSDYAKYVSAVENSNFSGVIMASIGNHDQTVVGNANFKRYAIYDGATKTWVGIDNAPAYFAQTYTGDLDITVTLAGENLAYYFATIDNNAFMFMDQELGPNGGTTTQDNFSKAQLNFVEQMLYTYCATHNLFIVEHAPIEQLKVGDKFVPGYGGCIQLNFNYPNNQRFLELLQEYTEAIWLSGHTHVQYDVGIMYVDKYYDAEGNLTDTPIAHSVHVSSLAQPRWYEGKNMIMQNDFSAASQGYVCYQYADDLAIEARSFKEYTPDSTSFDASLFINEVNSIYSMMIPLETKTHEAPTALVDLAVAANGVKRQGNVTFADTAEGLQVTFEADSNRFEIKTGNQTKAYNHGYYLQFKIKTDLTSITLGGCNYNANRASTLTVDLVSGGEDYTVIDMGDGWKFVQIPFTVLGVESYLTEFAIRFYNTNAAGTFILKDMFIEPFDYSFMRGETFAGGSNKTITLSETATSQVSFEYRIMEGETMRFAFLESWSSYFGYYLFDANGEAENYAGITTEKLSDGYVKVTATLSEMNKIHSDATAVTMLYISGGNASGYIDNIQIQTAPPQEPEVSEFRGQEIVVGQDLSVMAPKADNYSQVILDMIVPAAGGENEIGIALLDADWEYYGYFYLEKTGLESNYAGVSAVQLEDGYWRVTIDIANITDSNRIHGDVGDIERVYINRHTTGGYIDNVQFVLGENTPEEPSVPESDIAAAATTLYVPQGEEFVILNLSDLQLHDGQDPQYTYDVIRQLVEKTNPDLITVLGDTAQDNQNYSATTNFANLVQYIDSFNIPWAPVFGNHDHDTYYPGYDSPKGVSDAWIMEQFASAQNCIFMEGPSSVDGCGNYIVHIKEQGTDKLVRALYFFDSLLVGVNDTHVQFYRDAVAYTTELNGGKTLESIVFVHIPLPEYATVYTQQLEIDFTDTVGTVGRPATDLASGTTEFFKAIKELGSTQNVIAGHDHENAYYMTYEGIKLIYNMKSSNGDDYHNVANTGGGVFTIGKTTEFRYERASVTQEVTEATAYIMPLLANWQGSGKGISFTFTATDTVKTGNTISFVLCGSNPRRTSLELKDRHGGWNRLTNSVTIDLSSMTASLGTVTANGDGTYTYSLKLTDAPLNTAASEVAYGDETLKLIYFNSVSHSFRISDLGYVDAALEIATDMELDVVDGAYSEISFEYMVTNDGVLYIAALSPDWSKYYGYYEFNANGKVWGDNGVYCELLDNGFYRVTLKTAEMDRTNNVANADNRPDTIGLLYVGGSNTATGYIRNIQFVEAAQPTAVDYAVAENGVNRQGSPTWEDTSDGLQVTFAAANNRFEIKCGDQTAAASGTLKFKIKTDLTSIKLGGCNYSGGRKTTITVDLTASGEGFTVTDLGDGWVLVEVPMSQIGVTDYLAEFAIRFYDTNAAGTFYLKDMNFIP